MTDYLFSNGELTSLGRVMSGDAYIFTEQVSCNLGTATIKYPSKSDPSKLQYVVTLLGDKVWFRDLPGLIQFSQLVGMQFKPDYEVIAENILGSVNNMTYLFELISRASEKLAERQGK